MAVCIWIRFATLKGLDEAADEEKFQLSDAIIMMLLM